MDALYDTRTVHPLDRYDYFRVGVGTELAPLAVHGHTPSRLLAAMSVAQIGDFEIEVLAWFADSEIATRRTERLIRACDPECYRIFLSVSGEIRLEQAGNQVDVRARDIALHDLSRSVRAALSGSYANGAFGGQPSSRDALTTCPEVSYLQIYSPDGALQVIHSSAHLPPIAA